MGIVRIILPAILLLYALGMQAQTPAMPAGDTNHSSITVVYDISSSRNSKSAGIEETYNGGIKTVMIQNGKARIRLVTLMRIQSNYFFLQDSALAKVLVTKESGKKKYKYALTALEWKRQNAKYDSISCKLLDDSKTVAGYTCKKAIITVPGESREITVYYSTALKPLHRLIEPLFACVPGMVLQYESETSDGSISFTANKISFDPLDESLLQEPATGYIKKRYIASQR